ncbi:MAG: 50S ribosomal protein L6 [bacterium]
MSRIGKQPVVIPKDVEVKINDNEITIKGPKGELNKVFPQQIEIVLKDTIEGQKEIIVIPRERSKYVSSLWGLFRSLIFNMVKGVTDGFEKKLEIEGVGYRASVQGDKLILNLGLSHPIEIQAPKDIEFKVEKNTIIVSGLDNQLVGQIAAKIRAQKKPEPYKGKGIRYSDEVVRRKTGKKTTDSD